MIAPSKCRFCHRKEVNGLIKRNAAQRAGLYDTFLRYNECVMLEKLKEQPDPERAAFIQYIERAVSMLPETEQQLIRLRYLNNELEYIKDYEIYRDQLQISENRYARIRTNAFAKLRILLGLAGHHYIWNEISGSRTSKPDPQLMTLLMLQNVLRVAKEEGLRIPASVLRECKKLIAEREEPQHE